MVFQFTPLHLTLGGIERSNQDHWVLIWLCIIDNYISLVYHRQLDSGAVRPRGLLFYNFVKIIQNTEVWSSEKL